MKRNNKTSNPISIFALILLVGGNIIYQLTLGQSTPCTPLQTTHQPSVSARWAKQDVHISESDHTQLTAVKGKLIYIGGGGNGLVAIDENTGEVIWQSADNSLFTLTASNDVLFVGGAGKVIAINPDNGKVIWKKHLFANVTKLLTRNDVLYADSTRDYYLLDPKTGNIIRSLEYTVNDTWNPDLPLWSSHLMDLEFVNNISFEKKKTGYPIVTAVQLVATNETTNTQIWSSTLSMVGEAVISPLGVLAFDAQGKLLMLNVESGAINELVKFTPPPNRYYECPDGGYIDYGFSVAIDSDTHMIFVYLGDGLELYAFKLLIS